MPMLTVDESIGVDEGDLPLSWTQLSPGPDLAIQLASVDWSTLSDRELVAAMDAARRQTTWTQALQLETVAELSRRRREQDHCVGSETDRRICGEVSLELTVPTGQAEELVAMAEILPASLPCTWAAMRTGRIDYHRARVMLDGLSGLPDELARVLDAELIADAEASTTTLLRRRVSRAVKKADPDAYAERTKTARAERRVEVWDNDDDTCDLVGRNLNAVDAHAIHNRLTAAAQAMKADGDLRPIDQIRLDLYRDLLRGIPLAEAVRGLVTDDTGQFEQGGPTGSDADGTSSRHSTADEVVFAAERQIARLLAENVDAELSRVFDRARAEGRLDGMARLIGEAAQAMRDALAPIVDAWCSATIIGSTAATRGDPGQNRRHGHDGYRPPAPMQRLIQRRHATCVYPRCNRRSARCDLDHTQPYDARGRTCKCNLAPLCRTHHRLFKQHWQWRLVQPWPGLLLWVAPAGTWHIVLPQ